MVRIGHVRSHEDEDEHGKLHFARNCVLMDDSISQTYTFAQHASDTTCCKQETVAIYPYMYISKHAYIAIAINVVSSKLLELKHVHVEKESWKAQIQHPSSIANKSSN